MCGQMLEKYFKRIKLSYFYKYEKSQVKLRAKIVMEDLKATERLCSTR